MALVTIVLPVMVQKSTRSGGALNGQTSKLQMDTVFNGSPKMVRTGHQMANV
jgi:hypothetical protein